MSNTQFIEVMKMSFQQTVLLIIVLFVIISFAGGLADPEREVLFEPGLAPASDAVIGDRR